MGYKYVTDEFSWQNFDVYMEKAGSGEVLHAHELENTKGYLDGVDCGGIYFCQNFDDLYQWVDELFDSGEIRCVDIIEVTPIGEIQERVYEDGRVAYVADSAKVQLLEVFPDALKRLISENLVHIRWEE